MAEMFVIIDDSGIPIPVRQSLTIDMVNMELNLGKGEGRYMSRLYINRDEIEKNDSLGLLTALSHKVNHLYQTAYKAISEFRRIKE